MVEKNKTQVNTADTKKSKIGKFVKVGGQLTKAAGKLKRYFIKRSDNSTPGSSIDSDVQQLAVNVPELPVNTCGTLPAFPVRSWKNVHIKNARTVSTELAVFGVGSTVLKDEGWEEGKRALVCISKEGVKLNQKLWLSQSGSERTLVKESSPEGVSMFEKDFKLYERWSWQSDDAAPTVQIGVGWINRCSLAKWGEGEMFRKLKRAVVDIFEHDPESLSPSDKPTSDTTSAQFSLEKSVHQETWADVCRSALTGFLDWVTASTSPEEVTHVHEILM